MGRETERKIKIEREKGGGRHRERGREMGRETERKRERDRAKEGKNPIIWKWIEYIPLLLKGIG